MLPFKMDKPPKERPWPSWKRRHGALTQQRQSARRDPTSTRGDPCPREADTLSARATPDPPSEEDSPRASPGGRRPRPCARRRPAAGPHLRKALELQAKKNLRLRESTRGPTPRRARADGLFDVDRQDPSPRDIARAVNPRWPSPAPPELAILPGQARPFPPRHRPRCQSKMAKPCPPGLAIFQGSRG